jgi:hypothetical protein
MDICMLIVVSVSLCANLLTQGIILHPISVKIPTTLMRDVRIEAIKPFPLSKPSFSPSSEEIIGAGIFGQFICLSH